MGKITVRNTQVLINNGVLGHAENEFFLYNFSPLHFFTFHTTLLRISGSFSLGTWLLFIRGEVPLSPSTRRGVDACLILFFPLL